MRRAVVTKSRVLGTSVRPWALHGGWPGKLHQRCGGRRRHTALVHHDGALRLGAGSANSSATNRCRVLGLSSLRELLVAGVVGDDELEAWRRLDQLAGLVYR